MKSLTPRTDAAAFPRTASIERGQDWNCVEANFARQLERELAEAKRQSDMLQKYLNEAATERDEIKKRFEYSSIECSFALNDRDRWRKMAEELAQQLQDIPKCDVASDASFAYHIPGSDWCFWMERRNETLSRFNAMKGETK